MQPPGEAAARPQGDDGGRAKIAVAERLDGIPAASGSALTGRAPTSFGPTGIRCGACSPGCTGGFGRAGQSVRAYQVTGVKIAG
jgi:hypothetical protein